MTLPIGLQRRITHLYEEMLNDDHHQVFPRQRLALYDAFGPTYALSYEQRIAALAANSVVLTHADQVRARLALLTAQHVLPLWFEVLAPFGLLAPEQVAEELQLSIEELVRLSETVPTNIPAGAITDHRSIHFELWEAYLSHADRQSFAAHTHAILQDYTANGIRIQRLPPTAQAHLHLRADLAPYRSALNVPMTGLPMHMVQLAEGVHHQTVQPGDAFAQLGDLHTILGNYMGYDEDTFPAQAYDVAEAAYEALKQALGLGPFDHLEITDATRDTDLMGRGAAAAAANKAWSGLFEDTYSCEGYDPPKQKAFWSWWLQEAIPAAWAAVAETNETQQPTMPFRQTVRVTAYRSGSVAFPNDEEDE